MEIQAKTIAFDDRMEHILRNSENQLANKKKFPWGNAVACGVIGICGTVVILYLIQQKKEKSRKRNEPVAVLH